jgi:formamidopyrimidine-DNA glycosylase
MPELPEVETMCRGIYPTIGKLIRSVSQPPCDYRPIQIRPSVAEINARMAGCRVRAIARLGKRVVMQTNDDSLILQPKMTGLVALEAPPDADHVRLQIDFSGKLRLQFWDSRGLGTVELMPTAELHERIVEGRLGPDALQITVEDFISRLQATARPIKVALLDQKLLAGVGNLYASEMLFKAKIDPKKPAARVSPARLRVLHQVMLEILQLAITLEGSTLSDGTYRNAVNDPGSYQNMHRVYDKAGETCSQCKSSVILRIVQAQRSTFYCPKCQRS